MNSRFGVLLLGLIVLLTAASAPGQTAPPLAIAAHPAPAPEADLDKRLEALDSAINREIATGRIAEAVSPAQKKFDLLERSLGSDHWRTGDARRALEDFTRIAAGPREVQVSFGQAWQLNEQGAELFRRSQYIQATVLLKVALTSIRDILGEDHPYTANCFDNVATTLRVQEKYAEAEARYLKALAIRLKTLGENHPDTARSYDNRANNLNAQRRHAEAEPFHRLALAIRLKKCGENHLETAQSYDNLAGTLCDQQKYAEAESLSRRAMAIYVKALGEDSRTAVGYNKLAYILDRQGEYAEAEPFERRALAIRLKTLGENHPETAQGYAELASNLSLQAKYSEAEPLYRKALAINLKVLDENHPVTALGYRHLGFNLGAQGKYAEAELQFRKTLAICLKGRTEEHPDIATCYHYLAGNLRAQGKYAEAEPVCRQALSILLKALGEDHRDTAVGYNNLAYILYRQEKYAEAEPLYHKALAIRLKTLGENHPDTADVYCNLAMNLYHQGKLGDAINNWTVAAAIFERIRGLRSASGLERALAGNESPSYALAVALARHGKPREAWARWEAEVARGLLEELSAHRLRPLTQDQHLREADLARQLQRFDEGIARLAAKGKRAAAEDQQLDALRSQQSTLRGHWVELENSLDHEYQAFAGKPSTLEEVQKALADDAALVGWLDVYGRHWACVIRSAGDPMWVKTPCSDPDGTCTPQDHQRDRDCQVALATNGSNWRDVAAAVARQRLGPLVPHLTGVKHLVVLPTSWTLAALPVDALVAALPDGSPRPVVSYAPSGSIFARLTAPRSQAPGPPRLLALGDPAFPKPASGGPAPALPDYGIAILAVTPNSTAALFRILPGDVLLEYNGKALKTSNDLAIVPSGEKAVRVPVRVWRDGEIRSLDIAAGPLGIQYNPTRTVAEVVLARRAATEILRPGSRGEFLAPLPGTRREVQAIAGLFPKDQVTTFLGFEATESSLQGLAASGALKSFRFLHLATHGKANPSAALGSALFFAAEPERPAASSADSDAWDSAPDGQITAEEIVRTWELDADLVVLSACESGLGRYAGGEGYLGFAQALFVKGARTLILSLWKVDDRATSLLMERLYQNLLGQRPGLAMPMPKAEALAEAKRWLRELTAREIDEELGRLTGGEQPTPRDSPLVTRRLSAGPKSIRRYEHPYFWAGFILIGDPG
jgi:hypothetical protein